METHQVSSGSLNAAGVLDHRFPCCVGVFGVFLVCFEFCHWHALLLKRWI